MAETVERLLIRIDATTEQLRRELKRAEKAVEQSNTRMGKAIGKMNSAWQGSTRWIKQNSAQFKLLGAAAVAGTGVAIRSIADYSDTFKNLQGQLKLVTNSQEELNTVWDESLQIANSTGSSLDATVTLYARMARATEELGVNQSDLLQMTETINQAMVVSGATAQEASAAIIQLSQGMAKGRLDGQELNAVLEQSPRLARLIADEMDKPIGALKDLGAAGEITSEVMIRAFKNGAGVIESEFANMPVTVGRAMNEVRNNLLNAFGRADLEPLVAQIRQFGDAISDPEVQKAMTRMAEGIVNLGTSAAGALPKMVTFTQKVGELIAKFRPGGQGSGSGTLEGFKDELAGVEARLESSVWRFAATSERIEEMEQKASNLRAAIALLEDVTSDTTNATGQLADVVVKAEKRQSALTDEVIKAQDAYRDHVESLGELEEITVDVEKRQSALTDEVLESQDAYRKVTQATEDLSRELQNQQIISKASAREQYVLNEALSAGLDITQDLPEGFRRSAEALYDFNQEAAKSEGALQEMKDAFSGARSTLSDFFFEFARDGMDAFDTLVDGFKSMITKMIAEAAANQIFLGIGGIAGSLGLSNVAQAATEAGGGGGFLGGAGSIFSSFGTPGGFAEMFGGLSTSAGNIASNFGLTGLGDMFYNQGLQVANMSNLGALGYGALSAGAGILGGYGANALFGGGMGTNIGSTLGGIAGTALGGPIGAGIGSFLGGAVGSLFGGDNNGDNRGRGTLDFGTGNFDIFGVGKSFEPKNVEAVQQVAAQLQQFAQSIGGSNAVLDITAGSNSGFRLNGQKFGKDVEAFMAEAQRLIIEGSESMSDALRGASEDFEGTAQEAQQFAQAMASISQVMEANPVEIAIEQFTTAQENSSRTLTSVYGEQLSQISQLISSYDGSAGAAANLNNALVQNKNTAYQLAIAIQEASAQMETMFTDSARRFREATMTQEQLLTSWTNERDFLLQALGNMSDPAQIEETATRINEIQGRLFAALSEEQQIQQGEAFAQFAEYTNQVVQNKLSATLDAAQRSQATLNAQLRSVTNGLNSAGNTFLQAAQTILQAAQRFGTFPQGDVT